jgi:predicted DNA binding protein
MYPKIGQMKHFFFENQRKVTIREIAKELNIDIESKTYAKYVLF